MVLVSVNKKNCLIDNMDACAFSGTTAKYLGPGEQKSPTLYIDDE